MKKIIEGFWKCDKCGRTKILSRYDSCPGCGSRRNDTTNFEMLDSRNYVSENVAKTIERRPDWLCPYCNNLNRANSGSCKSCGAPKNTSTKNYFQNKMEREQKELERKKLDNNYIRYNNEDIDDDLLLDNEDNFESSNKNKKVKDTGINLTSVFENIIHNKFFQITLGVLGVALFALLLFFIFKPKVENVEITGFSWKSSISIEEYKTVKESDWYLPAGARLQYTKEEISHYEDVFDHYETRIRTITREEIIGYEDKVEYIDLGNGYFEENKYSVPVYGIVTDEEEYQEAVYRSEPVYATKYYYEIDKWVYRETINETGNDKKPYYPKLNLLSNERESSRSQVYFVTGNNEDGESITVSVTYDEWMKLDINQTVKFKIYFDNSAKIVSTEE